MTERAPEQVAADGIYADTWAEPDPNRPEWHHRFARWQANCAAQLALAALRAEGYAVVKVDEGLRTKVVEALLPAIRGTRGGERESIAQSRAADYSRRVLTALGLSEPVENRGAVMAAATCQGFEWIGQSFDTCDGCGEPAWHHDYMMRAGEHFLSDGLREPWSAQLVGAWLGRGVIDRQRGASLLAVETERASDG